ncbi:hypothetical protein MCUN1_003661 [Malassezia cuniculi]|uniref:Uncharacterized protein n=1 Tax=Malassezia cuniculi TaxID=948313 RepID=A0AAF0EX48_9BASI|nr:hypothetical protein MCUN1_003661 [Malassezia cuniculi]
MPSILVNPRQRQSAPQVHQPPRSYVSQASSSRNVGQRRLRRSENIRPSPRDYTLVANPVATKFAEPDCPLSLRESAPDHASPQYSAPCFDRESAICGQFNMSLADARQFLRTRSQNSDFASAVGRMSLNSTPLSPIEKLIATASSELDSWINQTVHFGTSVAQRVLVSDGENGLVEIRRSPTALVWATGNAYSRLAIHCVARTRECPSYSRTITSDTGPPQRHTWILHPNPLMRGSRRRTAVRPTHRRGDSSGTISSTASSAVVLDTRLPIAAGLLEADGFGIHTPPDTEVELSDVATEFETDSLSGRSELDTQSVA